jgi:hypothetical protein
MIKMFADPKFWSEMGSPSKRPDNWGELLTMLLPLPNIAFEWIMDATKMAAPPKQKEDLKEILRTMKKNYDDAGAVNKLSEGPLPYPENQEYPENPSYPGKGIDPKHHKN